jgi:hypothetical protein
VLASPIVRHNSHLKFVLLPGASSGVERDIALKFIVFNTWKREGSQTMRALSDECLRFAGVQEALRPGVDLWEEDGDGGFDGI